MELRVLEDYFNDIYHLFLNKLVRITHESNFTKADEAKLNSLFKELVRVKHLLQKEAE